MEHNKNFKVGDKVLCYAHEKAANEIRERDKYYFSGTITEIDKDTNIATIQVRNSNLYYELSCLRHIEEVEEIERLRNLWLEFENTEVDIDNCIAHDFHDFKAGTEVHKIYDWFNEQCPNGFGADLIGVIEDYDIDTSQDYVRCNHCMTRMLVPVGVDKCPHCQESGYLTDLWEPDDWTDLTNVRFVGKDLPDGYDPLND